MHIFVTARKSHLFSETLEISQNLQCPVVVFACPVCPRKSLPVLGQGDTKHGTFFRKKRREKKGHRFSSGSEF